MDKRLVPPGILKPRKVRMHQIQYWGTQMLACVQAPPCSREVARSLTWYCSLMRRSKGVSMIHGSGRAPASLPFFADLQAEPR
jgi:hypothetical protein